MDVSYRNIYAFRSHLVKKLNISSINYDSNRNNDLSEYEMKKGSNMGIDSHADTSCAGRHVRVLEYIDGSTFTVSPFHKSYSPIENVRLVNGIVAVDFDDGKGLILELNNFLDFSQSMEHSILVPMQARVNNVIVDDIPKSLCTRGISTQSIIIPNCNRSIPIDYNGPIPYFKIRYPTDEDMDHYEWFSLTDASNWNPYDLDFNLAYNDSKRELSAQSSTYHKAVNNVFVSASSIDKTSSSFSPIYLSKLWKVSLKDAKLIMNTTTYSLRRVHEGQMTRRFRTDLYQRRYRRLGGQFARFYTDTLFYSKSTQGNTCAQIYVNRTGFTKIYPISSKSNAHETLSVFIHEVGIPHSLHTDDARELTSGMMQKKMRRYEIYNTQNEPYSPWQNLAENAIGVVKSKARRFMRETNTPIRLIDYVLKYVSELRNYSPSHAVGSNGRTPHELVLGETPDISEYVTFSWYDYIWYWTPTLFQKQNIGRWLGVAHAIGSGHVYFVINSKGEVLARSTVTKLNEDEMKTPGIIEQMKDLDNNIKERIGTYDDVIFNDDVRPQLDEENLNIVPFDNDYENVIINSPNDLHEDLATEINDKYLGIRVVLPHLGQNVEGIVKSRKRTADGKLLVGKEDVNPYFDTRIYNVEFPDGSTEEYTTNMICESIYDQMDEENDIFAILKGIIGYRKNSDAIPMSKGYVEVNGKRKRVITLKGWDLRIEWMDETTSWMPLHIIKSSNPIETAEFAISRNIHHEPAFAWWVNDVIRRRDRIISKLKTTRKSKKNVKFGIKIPISVNEAREFDKTNGNSHWEDAINKELSKVRVAFELIQEGDEPLPGSKMINYHFIFDIKHDMTRKARLVAGGHLNKHVPSFLTYSSVVSKETVRLCFMLASLNNLNVLIGDIGNAYLNARPREKCHVVITDPYLFGPSAVGKKAQIVRALYGMKSSGAAWRDMLAGTLHQQLKFENCMADHDLWQHPDLHPDGSKYYTYICIYVDDILIVSYQPSKYMDMLKIHFLIKPESIKSPDLYLGMTCKMNNEGIWLLSPNGYTREFLRVSEKIISGLGLKLPLKGKHPFSNIQYRPEEDVTDFCNELQIQAYQQIIGMLRWMVELGRVDILYETTVLSSCMISPRIGHLKQLINIVSYLKNHDRSTLIMDPHRLDIQWTGSDEDHPEKRRAIMKTIYRDAIEDLPSNAPECRGKEVELSAYCDSDHAGDRSNRRSHTGILIFGNMAPISWFSKKQNTIESSTFGAEYVALRITIEKIVSLRYKLRMMGVPFSGPSNIFMDNESVVKSALNSDAALKKKHVSIAYHKSREAFAAGIISIFWVPSNENLADLFTKTLSVEQRKFLFRSGIFY